MGELKNHMFAVLNGHTTSPKVIFSMQDGTEMQKYRFMIDGKVVWKTHTHEVNLSTFFQALDPTFPDAAEDIAEWQKKWAGCGQQKDKICLALDRLEEPLLMYRYRLGNKCS